MTEKGILGFKYPLFRHSKKPCEAPEMQEIVKYAIAL